MGRKLNRSESKGRAFPKAMLLEQLYNLYMFILTWLFSCADLTRAAGWFGWPLNRGCGLRFLKASLQFRTVQNGLKMIKLVIVSNSNSQMNALRPDQDS